MMKHLRVQLAAAAGVLAVGMAAAQEISPVFDMGGLAATASLGAVINSERARAAGSGGLTRAAAPSVVLGKAFTQPAPAGAAALPMDYRATPALSRAVVATFVERVRSANPAYGKAIQTQLAQHDYRSIYGTIVGPYGLAGDDAANALAAYLLLGWMIVHEGQEPSAAAIRGVRAQAAAALTNQQLNGPEVRAQLGEEFKILFVTLHAGWQSARREGKLAPYASGVADMFRRTDGIDLGALTPGPGGFRRG